MRKIFTNVDTTPLPTPCNSTQIAYKNHCDEMKKEKGKHCKNLAAYKKLNPKCDPKCLAEHLKALEVFYNRNAKQEIIKAEQEIIIKDPSSRPKVKKDAKKAKEAAENKIIKNDNGIDNYLAGVGFPKNDEKKIIAALKGLAAREITRKMLEDARLKLIGVIGSFKNPPCKLPDVGFGSKDCDERLKQKRQRNK
jgi:hypothetical protein